MGQKHNANYFIGPWEWNADNAAGWFIVGQGNPALVFVNILNQTALVVANKPTNQTFIQNRFADGRFDFGRLPFAQNHFVGYFTFLIQQENGPLCPGDGGAGMGDNFDHHLG